MDEITVVDADGEIVISADEMRHLRQKALADCGFTIDEYRAYMVGKCHHKCWRPDGASSWSWHSVRIWDDLLEGDHG